MKIECDNCGKVSEESELSHAFPNIPDLVERIAPGEPVPFGECPECGALMHAIEETFMCLVCSAFVKVDELRDHLIGHNPNADGLSWEDIRNQFTLMEKRGEVRSLVCPKCGAVDRIAEIDIIPGYALVGGVKKDGSLEWTGETDVDWDGQRPANNPREFVCLACNEKFGGEAIGL